MVIDSKVRKICTVRSLSAFLDYSYLLDSQYIYASNS